MKVDLFCVFIHLGLSFLVMFIMKTSHKRDELKKIKKGGGSTNRVPMGGPTGARSYIFTSPGMY